MPELSPLSPSVRLDIWLWAARFFKTRSLAKQAIETGKVSVAGQRPKSSRAVRVGEQLQVDRGEEHFEIQVLGLSDQRITNEGVVVIKAQDSRSLERNRADAVARLVELVQAAAHVPKARKATRPTRASQQRRLAGKASRAPHRRLMAGLRRYRRVLLLVVLPTVAVIAGGVFYLNGGRYVGTDDAYVGAQKVLITPEISGKIDKIVVKEGQHVKKGDELFEIDPVPFRLAVDQAKAALDQTRTTYDNLVDNIKINTRMLEFAQQSIELKKRDVDRKSTLAKQNFGSQLDLDNAANAQVTAESLAQYVKQQISKDKTQLLGDVELPIEKFPPYAQAKAKLDEARKVSARDVALGDLVATETHEQNVATEACGLTLA